LGFSNVHGIPGLPAVSREARILDGRAPAAAMRERVAEVVADRRAAGEPAPSLATIVVGHRPAADAYAIAIDRACARTGVSFALHEFGAEAGQQSLEARVASLNGDSTVSGIVLQLPLPEHLDAHRLLELIDPAKDVDGLGLAWASRPGHPEVLVPATAKGIVALLDHHGIELAGRRAVVVGRSELVGRPVATLLSRRDSTVTVCHSRSRDLEQECRRAEVLIAAAGKPHLIDEAHVRRGATVVDVGIHRRDDALIGDVDYEAVRRRAGAVTPVPGGVGPMTVASLLENTLAAARRSRSPAPALG
jgi:methylenetetrahydrofolate dehydrogenase (NADP+)/methenyltetrahydrofolate cyclohydrolase